MSTDEPPSTIDFTVSWLYDGIDYDFRPETFWAIASELLGSHCFVNE